MANRTETLSYPDLSHTIPLGDGRVQSTIIYTHAQAEMLATPKPGTALVRTRAAGLCTSEIAGGGYYGRVVDPDQNFSRYLKDRSDLLKQEAARQRLFNAGFSPDSEMVMPFLLDTGFHEGVVQILEANPTNMRDPLPIPFYAPVTQEDGNTHFEKIPFTTNFQGGFEEGSHAVLNPAHVCDYHSNASKHPEAVKKTGWTTQCDRSNDHGHSPKATRGHVEAPGTAINGIMPVLLDTMTPLSPILNRYVGLDRKNLFVPLNVEPMGCVFHAHGPMLIKNWVPKSIVIIGDGSNTLNMLAFYQVFAPKAQVILVGKNPAKLEVLKSMNPEQITTLTTKGDGNYSELDYTLKGITGGSQADLVVPMVCLEDETINPRVRKGGTVIWWAASKSEHSNGFMEKVEGITHIRPYGGAPRTEFSAVALFDYLLTTKPEVLDVFLRFPGITHAQMGPEAAKITQDWLNSGGRYVDPQSNLSTKPVFYM